MTLVTELETSAASRHARRPGLTTLWDIVLLSGAIAVTSLVVKLSWPRFTFWGDNAESFFPLWHMYGASIRAGRPALFQADGWAGGNVIGEAAYGVLNPVVVVNSILISLTDRLSLASFLVMTEFLCLFGVGVYLLARSYGARRVASFVAGSVMPFAGYTVFYEAGNWASGLMSVVWVTWFWWGAHELTAGRRGPLAAIIAGVLAVTVGNPYAVLGILIVLAGLGVEAVFERRWRVLGTLTLTGAVVGVAVAAVYIPLLATLPDTVRVTAETIRNENYLTPGLGDLLGLSSPGYLPRMNAWYSRWDAVPSTYLSWIILPLLPWFRWRSAVSGFRLLSVFVIGGLFLLLCLGPQSIWLFQWPIRLIEYTYVAILVVFAALLTAGLARDHVRARLTLTGAAIGAGFFVAWSSRPDLWEWHLAFMAVTAAGTAGILVAAGRGRKEPIAFAVILGTVVVAPLQTQLFAWDRQHVSAELDQEIPANLAVIREQSADLEGTVLQVAWLRALDQTDAVSSGELSFGNSRAAAGYETVNRYTGIGFLDFSLATGMDYRGSTPSDHALEHVFRPVEDYGVPLVEAMGVDTLVVSPRVPDSNRLSQLARGWAVVAESPNRIILRAPWNTDLRLTPSVGLEIANAAADGSTITFDVAAGSGSVLLPRVAWRGYSASADGAAVVARAHASGLLEVVVPDGTTTVKVTYTIPGAAAVVTLGVLLVAVTALLQIGWWRRHSRTRPHGPGAGRLS